MARLNSLEDTINKNQLLFGINQGAIFDDIRIDHAKAISEMNLDGYAVGGLAVGESHEEMYHILDVTVPHLPLEKPTYLMGVGTRPTFWKQIVVWTFRLRIPEPKRPSRTCIHQPGKEKPVQCQI